MPEALALAAARFLSFFLERWPQVYRVKIMLYVSFIGLFTELLTNRFVSTTKISMKCVVNWIIENPRSFEKSHLKGGPEPSNFEDLCLVNVSVKCFSKLCFGTSQIQLNSNI